MYDAAPFKRCLKQIIYLFILCFRGSELIDSSFRHFRQDALNFTKRFHKVCIDLVNSLNLSQVKSPLFI